LGFTLVGITDHFVGGVRQSCPVSLLVPVLGEKFSRSQ